jgi:hypothetical protein
MRAFANAERFVSELESRKLRPAYVFVGDEAFFASVFAMRFCNIWFPPELRDFSISSSTLRKTTWPKFSTAPVRPR